MMVNLDSEKTCNGAPEQSHQNLIGLCFDLQSICMKLDISAEPRRYVCRYRVMTLRCETFLSALIPPHHHTEQIKPGVFCSATLLSRNVVCFGVTLSGVAPPFSLVFPLSPQLFIYRLKNLRGSSKRRPEEFRHASINLLPDTILHFLLYTCFLLTVPLPEVFLSSSLSKCEESDSAKRKPDFTLCCCFYWLAPCSLCAVPQLSQSSSSTLRFNPSIDCDVKMFLKIQSE